MITATSIGKGPFVPAIKVGDELYYLGGDAPPFKNEDDAIAQAQMTVEVVNYHLKLALKVSHYIKGG